MFPAQTPLSRSKPPVASNKFTVRLLSFQVRQILGVSLVARPSWQRCSQEGCMRTGLHVAKTPFKKKKEWGGGYKKGCLNTVFVNKQQ